MATPMHVYNDIAGRYGVDPTNDNAVDRFFMYRVPKLPKATQQAIVDELFARNGEPLPRQTPKRTASATRSINQPSPKRIVAASSR